MKSCIYFGKVSHKRSHPEHSFDYELFTFGLELDELSQLNYYWPLLGYNRRALFSFYDCDYLKECEGTLPEKFFAKCSNVDDGDSARLITMPRFFGYVFNPVNFYFHHDASGRLKTFVAEVHNTFGETFSYVMPHPYEEDSVDGDIKTFECTKRFLVSPFFDDKGTYELIVKEYQKSLSITVRLLKLSKEVLSAHIEGSQKSITFSTLLHVIFWYPLCCWLTIVRIYWQACRLYYVRKLHLPAPVEFSKDTEVTTRPHIWHKLLRNITNYFFR